MKCRNLVANAKNVEDSAQKKAAYYKYAALTYFRINMKSFKVPSHRQTPRAKANRAC